MPERNDLPDPRVPLISWCPVIEPEARAQVEHLIRLPFAFHHVALMPDAHTGYGMPIGGVLATREVVIPNAVGVDIGCGMIARPTSLAEAPKDKLKEVIAIIRALVPLGPQHHRHINQEDIDRHMPRLHDGDEDMCPVITRQYDNALRQLGTLGGGNHFIELQKGSDGKVWIMIHSGSRNLGKQVADHYNEAARAYDGRHRQYEVPDEWQLAWLPIDHELGHSYLQEMKFCVDFALANRRVMMDKVSLALQQVFPGIRFEEGINIAHNYASLEEHFGRAVMVHRKGATQARRGQLGIIPGSQGSKSYIVRGKGNPDSFESCSHGAGRLMSRHRAMRELDLGEEIRKLNDQGIVHGIRTTKDLDEAAGAYKPIDEVMRAQRELVEIEVELSPLAVVKG